MNERLCENVARRISEAALDLLFKNSLHGKTEEAVIIELLAIGGCCHELTTQACAFIFSNYNSPFKVKGSGENAIIDKYFIIDKDGKIVLDNIPDPTDAYHVNEYLNNLFVYIKNIDGLDHLCYLTKYEIINSLNPALWGHTGGGFYFADTGGVICGPYSSVFKAHEDSIKSGTIRNID